MVKTLLQPRLQPLWSKEPVILNGAGVVLSEGGLEASQALAERLTAPVCVGYRHNDAFPGNHRFCRPLGYNGSKAGMKLIKEADVVLCLGTRLNRSHLPGYGMEYWPADAEIIQVIADRIGLTERSALASSTTRPKLPGGSCASLTIMPGTKAAKSARTALPPRNRLGRRNCRP